MHRVSAAPGLSAVMTRIPLENLGVWQARITKLVRNLIKSSEISFQMTQFQPQATPLLSNSQHNLANMGRAFHTGMGKRRIRQVKFAVHDWRQFAS